MLALQSVYCGIQFLPLPTTDEVALANLINTVMSSCYPQSRASSVSCCTRLPPCRFWPSSRRGLVQPDMCAPDASDAWSGLPATHMEPSYDPKVPSRTTVRHYKCSASYPTSVFYTSYTAQVLIRSKAPIFSLISAICRSYVS